MTPELFKWQARRDRQIFALLIVTTVVAFSSIAVQAKSPPAVPSCAREPEAYIAPETLVMMAYRGAFTPEGIPGYEELEMQFNMGGITAREIVRAAVTGCFLSNKYGIAEHDNYVNEVKKQMQLLMPVFKINGNFSLKWGRF